MNQIGISSRCPHLGDTYFMDNHKTAQEVGQCQETS